MVTQGSHTSKKHHSTRFYIFMITLVIGGLFLFLFLNNNENSTGFSTGLTSAIIGHTSNTLDESKDNLVTNSVKKLVSNSKEEKSNQVPYSSRFIPFHLLFNVLPSGVEELTAEKASFHFTDVESSIKVNDDTLELNDLSEIDLSLSEFSGIIDFQGDIISLSGEASKINVNGVSFASEKELTISFEDLPYTSLSLLGVKIDDLDLSTGSGSVSVGDRLTYELYGDEVSFFNFKGKMDIRESSEGDIIDITGEVQGASVSGDALNLNLR